MIKTAVLTVSDSCSKGQREDLSRQTIKDILARNKFEVCEKRIVADDKEKITAELIYFSDAGNVDKLFTTGGTGLGPHDITPEATIAVCEKIVPGLHRIKAQQGQPVLDSVLTEEVTTPGRLLLPARHHSPHSPQAIGVKAEDDHMPFGYQHPVDFAQHLMGIVCKL